jgi:TP901 family phage tail tape measure protein
MSQSQPGKVGSFMALTAASLIARVSVEGASAAQGQLLGMGAAADATQARFRGLATIGAGLLVAGLIAVGVKSAEMAADFQQAVNRLRTGAGDTQDSFATLAKGILAVSVATGVMTGPLNQAMYLIISSGQRGAQAFDTLKVAAQGATIEQANVADVANVLSGVMTNYGTKIYGATQYMNGLIEAVKHGKITLQDLSTAMGPIDPIAQQLGISMADVAAAMTTQTNAMIPAARAATGLRFMMQALEKPTHQASAEMQNLGLDSVKVAEEMKVSLPGALQMIVNAALKVGPEGSVPFNRAVSDMVGGIRGLSAFMALTGPHMKDFIANSKDIAAAMSSGARQVQGWDIAQTNFNVIMDKAKASIAAAAISFGLLLLPALGRIVAVIPQVVDYFSHFSEHANVLVPIIAGLGAAILYLLVPPLVTAAAAMIAATWPALAIGAAVAGLAAIFMHFYSTNAGFKAFIDNLVVGFKQVASFVIANFIPAMQQIGTFLRNNVLPILQQIGGFLVSTFAPLWKELATVWQSQISPSLKQLWEAIQPVLPALKALGAVLLGIVIVALGLLVGILAGTVKALAGFLGGVAHIIGGIIQVFTGVVQIISGIVTFISDLCTGHFNKLGADLARIWAGIVNIFHGVWSIIKGIFQAAVGAVSGYVSGFVGAVIGFFQHLASVLVGHSIIPDMINAIIQWFTSLPGRALSAVGSLASSLASFFSGLAQKALSWGANIIGNLASGIIGAIGSTIGNAMSAVGNFISSHLPSSPVKMGPLKDLELQGSKIPEQIAAGIASGMPSLTPMLNMALTPSFSPAISGGSGGGGGSKQPVHITINIAGRRVADAILPDIVTAIRNGTGARF